jgi:hypothetical protein
VGADGRGLNGGRLYRLKNLNHFRRWMPGWLHSVGSRFAHLDALERHLDRMDQSTLTKRKTRRE